MQTKAANRRIDDDIFNVIFESTRDLLSPDVECEYRRMLIQFFVDIFQSHYACLDMARAVLLFGIRGNASADDLDLRIEVAEIN